MTEVRIGCGLVANYTDSLGRVWAADNSFSGGDTYTLTNPIANTSDQVIFRSERSAAAQATFSYSISVPNGDYILKLGFAEIGFANGGARVFSVSAQGIQILFNYDIIVDTGASNRAGIKTFRVSVTNEVIQLSFVSGVDNAKISNIEIMPLLPSPLMLLAC